MTTTVPDYGSMNEEDLQAHTAALVPAVHAMIDAHPGVSARVKRKAAHWHDQAEDLDRLLFEGGQIAARSGDPKDP